MKLVLFFLLISSAWSLDLSQRRKAIIEIVDEEISEVNRLDRQVKGNDPNLLMRLAELNLEKARLIMDEENENYLAIPAEQRRKLNKKKYFSISRKYFSIAQNHCETLLRKFKRFSAKGDVYYVMAYNAKELRNVSQAQKYLNLAIKTSSKNSQTRMKSQISLAEIYYNKKQYKKAIPLYVSSLSKVDDRWWTKDAVNLAWCYFRVKNYSKAISFMNEVYRKSESDKYTDMRDTVLRDVGLFYAQANRTLEGLEFYRRAGKNYTNELLSIASRLKSEGNYAQAKIVLTELLKIEKVESNKVLVYAELIELYDQFGRTESLLNTAQTLKTYHDRNLLNPDQLSRLIYHVDRQAAVLQKQVVGKTYRRVYKTRRAKAKQAYEFFQISYDLNPGKRAEIRFYQGETFFAIGQYETALKYYEMAYNEASITNDANVKKMSLEALLSTLGQKGLNSKAKDKYYVIIYKKYLENDSSSSRAKSIYQKLFNTYFERKELDETEKTVYSFRQSFPSEFKTQEAMIAKLIDYYRKVNRYDKVVFWINEVKSCNYSTTANYKEKVKDLETNMQMKDVQAALARGDKLYALEGYHKVYANPKSTPDSKKNSAYNIAALYYELGDVKKTYDWTLISLEEMKPKEIDQFDDSFLTFSSFFFNKRNFLISADLSERILGKLCRVNSSKKGIFFKNSIFIYLAEGKLDKAEETLGTGKRCDVDNKYLNEARIEILKEFGIAKRWETFEEILNRLETYESIRVELIPFFDMLKTATERLGESGKVNDIKNKVLKYYYEAKSKKQQIPLESLDVVADYLFENVNRDVAEISNIKLTFPEAKYNDLLKRKLTLLDKVASSALKVHETGSGKGIVRSYFIIIKAYRFVANEIKDFSPEGKSSEYIASFKKTMEDLVSPILKQADDYQKEAIRQIYKHDILSKDTFLFLSPDGQIDFDYSYSNIANLMSAGGKR